MKEIGWRATDYSFDELYDAYLSIIFEYQGRNYRLSCESDQCLYDLESGNVLWTFSSKKSFYSGIIFGRPIHEVIDDSYIICLL